MRTSNRLTVIAAALRPLVVQAKSLEVDLDRAAPGGVTWAKVERARMDLESAVESLAGEADFLRRGGD